MQSLFPKIQAYQADYLQVDQIHRLFIEQSGNKNGIPIVFIHGGPGGGCDPNSKRYFDPNVYRIITFDQRGCGQSTPHASLENNTTWHLVDDLEKIRQFLGIEKWLVFGGSWGSTLALAYAQKHHEVVLGLILRGIYLCRPKDIQWYYQEGVSNIYPDAWSQYIKLIPQSERNDLVTAYYRRLTSEDKELQLQAATEWFLWEMRTSNLIPIDIQVTSEQEKLHALAFSRIECHYFVNNAFLEPDQLLKNAYKIAHIPTVLVHGRYDMPCPFENAYLLHQKLPNSQLRLIANAGHSANELGITDALISATNDFANKLA